jgi:hypothetical protein
MPLFFVAYSSRLQVCISSPLTSPQPTPQSKSCCAASPLPLFSFPQPSLLILLMLFSRPSLCVACVSPCPLARPRSPLLHALPSLSFLVPRHFSCKVHPLFSSLSLLPFNCCIGPPTPPSLRTSPRPLFLRSYLTIYLVAAPCPRLSSVFVANSA